MRYFAAFLFAILLLIFSCVWREVFMFCGISELPKKFLVCFPKDKAFSLEQLEVALKKTVDSLRSQGLSIYLKNDGRLFSINRGNHEPWARSSLSSLIYISGDIEGQILISDKNEYMYNRLKVEGNYFVSRKKTQEDKEFIDKFLKLFTQNLEPLVGGVTTIEQSDD